MFSWFKRKESPEKCVENLVTKYFGSKKGMSDEDFQKLKNCLENWSGERTADYYGAMAYVRYMEGDVNKMWDYIEEDLQLDLGEEEHGAFIPAMMADVEPEIRYKIVEKIHERIGGKLSKELMEKFEKEL